MNVEYIIAIAVAIAIGVVNLVIKVNEKMNSKKTNGRRREYPCSDHAERIKENKAEVKQLRTDFTQMCLNITEKMTRVETIVANIDEKIDGLTARR